MSQQSKMLHDKTISARHLRTRSDHQTETAEDYVEAIAEILKVQPTCRIVDLASRFAVSNVTVHRIVERLETNGLVKTEPYKPIVLTTTGKKLAIKCRKRHEIVFKFLVSIGVNETTAEIDAEGMEHHVSAETLKCFEQIVQSGSCELDNARE